METSAIFVQGPQENLQQGRLCLAQGQSDAAIAALGAYLQACPHQAEVWRELGQAYEQKQWLFHQALCLERAQQAQPGQEASRYDLARTWNRLGQHDQFKTLISQILGRPFARPDASPDARPQTESPAASAWQQLLSYLSHYQELLVAYADPDIHDSRLFELVGNLPELVSGTATEDTPPHPPTGFAPQAPDPDRPLRVGYLSPEFAQSVTLSLLAPLLSHRGGDFELYAYDDTPAPPEPALQAHFAAWRPIHGLDNPTVAAQIRQDAIDILVDLTGLPNAWRYGVFALRPAPVQLTGLSFAFSSGCRQMDACFSDAVLTPPEIAAGYPEHVIQLPCVFHWQAQAEYPLQAPPCHPDGALTFGSANSLNKLNESVLRLWARLLQHIPTARLFLKTPVFNDPLAVRFYCELFEHFGIAPERLRLEGQHHSEHMGYFYPQIDIALDSFPFQGGVTSLEALWMGVPVVSLFQPQWRSRALTASILTSLGLQDWLTGTEAEYLERACQWAADKEFLWTQRQSLRARLQASPICDHAGNARRIEAAYRQCWRQACQRKK